MLVFITLRSLTGFMHMPQQITSQGCNRLSYSAAVLTVGYSNGDTAFIVFARMALPCNSNTVKKCIIAQPLSV
jgi:hypothetical protein